MKQPLAIIECPSNLGLKMPQPGHEPGVKKLPHWLNKCGFHQALRPSLLVNLEPPPYSGVIDEATGIRNTDELVQYASLQAGTLQRILAEGYLPLVLGGDCSILIGNIMALKRQGSYGLFFLDGHTDFIWPALSHTAGAAGMDLAIVTGHGHDRLADIDNLKPYVDERWVWCVGNREYDAQYLQPILDSNIRYYDLRRLRRKGMEACVGAFLSMVEQEYLDGFWIHMDVDVLNDDIMPAVDSRNSDGLWYDELCKILSPLLLHPNFTGLQITILDPELDPEGQATKQFVNRFTNLFNECRQPFETLPMQAG